jgi:hypothetical protein
MGNHNLKGTKINIDINNNCSKTKNNNIYNDNYKTHRLLCDVRKKLNEIEINRKRRKNFIKYKIETEKRRKILVKKLAQVF